MRLLFDHGVPSLLRRFLVQHEVTFAKERGWAEYVNGRLLAAAEEAGFEVMVTCDKKIVFEQNLTGRRIGLAILPTNIWPHLRPHVAEVVAFIDAAVLGECRKLELPRPELQRRPPPPQSGEK